MSIGRPLGALILFVMQLHRNSQKRMYVEEGIYFVTFNTNDKYPYFEEEIFCEVFMDNLRICRQLKRFELYAYNLLYDHAHLLLKPGRGYNVSKIIQNLKMNTSRNINKIMGYETDESANTYSRFDIGKYRKAFIHKYGKFQSEMPRFQWQKSFHTHTNY
jgi:REP element-mobilizing transposase RayT